jgi:hypothetical protein
MKFPASSRHVLWVFLAVQGCLLLIRPGLLPVWGDEVGTLRISTLPLDKMPDALRQDYHPPLYYALAHMWLRLPLPGLPVERARVLSGLLLLLATWAIHKLWLQELDSRSRAWFLVLWTFSPCLLLYGRMARPYALQVLLGCLAIHAGQRLVEALTSRRRGAVFALGALALLYTHYAPGLAVAAGVNLLAVWIAVRRRQWPSLVSLATVDLLIALGYLPWVRHMLWSVAMTAQFRSYTPSANPMLEHPIKLAYWFVSFTFGETFPLWVVALGLVVAPLLLVLVWRGLRQPPAWLAVVVPTGAIAYYGVARWVSFAFVPARLLFLLPFYLLLLVEGMGRSRRAGLLAGGLVLVSSAAATYSYFHQENFLSKAYVVPNEEIARTILPRLPAAGALLVIDAYNTSIHPVIRRLPASVAAVFVGDDDWEKKLSERMAEGRAATIWYIRNTHDVSPQRVVSRLEKELTTGRQVERFAFVRYSALDRLVMRLLGWPEQPSHMLQATEIRR